ncbi:MAG: RagB/SusD family nutrient uptake outer membrane protein [Parabacteroides sp.]|nr:RagB/SusD family nutrient uptake outer membrane protein [Parabacteroides sp.]
MKKKSVISFLAGASLLFSMSACTNLDETVYDKLSADSFGSTEIEINALVGTVYKTLKQYPADGNFLALDVMSGSDAVTPTRKGGDWYDGGQYREIYMHTWTAQTSCIKNAWSTASEAIGTCNSNMEVVKASEILSDARKTQLIAEIRGVRAFWIYKMMDEWGNVPLVTDYVDKELPTCQPRQTVFDWLITEVNEIKDQCPDRDGNYGKFTKGAAYTLLAKLCLNAEAWGVSYSGNAYQTVVESCDKVMSMGYTLESDFKKNFALDNSGSNESILAAPFSESDGDKDNRWQLMNRTLHYKDQMYYNNGISAWNGVCAQPDYVKQFSDDDPRKAATYLTGKMINSSTGEVIMTDHGFELNHTIDVAMLPGTEYDGTTWGAVNQHDGARCQKWPFDSPSLTNAMGNDFFIFRYADVLLMKAEALLRSGGSAAEATSLVNQVRERAFGDSDHNKATVTLNDVMLERRFELSWELHNRQDDIRFGVYEKGMWSASNCARKADAYLKLFPVSQDAYQSNDKLTQNPGYPAFSK